MKIPYDPDLFIDNLEGRKLQSSGSELEPVVRLIETLSKNRCKGN